MKCWCGNPACKVAHFLAVEVILIVILAVFLFWKGL